MHLNCRILVFNYGLRIHGPFDFPSPVPTPVRPTSARTQKLPIPRVIGWGETLHTTHP